MFTRVYLVVLLLSAGMLSTQASTETLPTAPRHYIPDSSNIAGAAAAHFRGLVGDRMQANIEGRLLTISEDDLLDGFRKRPGKHPWIGEHVGKWLHASSLAYLNSKNPKLRERMDHIAKELIKTQEADGYLGTYAPNERMGFYGENSWDIWVHKYSILGLLAYYYVTQDAEALAAAKRAGDYLVKAFPAEGAKDINETSQHVGMASGSVIEPLVLLSRATQDPQYLDLAERIVLAWDRPTGSHLLSNLLKDKTVLTVGNRKAYEMLSCLVGLCELYRSTGREEYLQAAQNAQADVAKNHMLLTGSGSADERWTENRNLLYKPENKVAETCVTVTWMQLNIQLFRLSGESRYQDELERTVYNHLLGAQRPHGSEFCYYTPLEGRKPYSTDLTCCFSSGARGLELIPVAAYSTSEESTVQVNLYGSSTAELKLGDKIVKLDQQTSYPLLVDISIKVQLAASQKFTMQLRVPAWSHAPSAKVNGTAANATAKNGWLQIDREWKDGDTITLQLGAEPRLIAGDQNTSGMAALTVGPLVYAADKASNPDVTDDALLSATLTSSDPKAVRLTQSPDTTTAELPVSIVGENRTLKLVPYYAAGADGSTIKTWFQLAPAAATPAAK